MRKGNANIGAEPLARTTRGGVADTIHYGSVVVVDARGKTLFSLGDPETRAYMRSSAKPIQCIPVIASGACDAFGFDPADVAIICGSHRGGDKQVRQVRAILAKSGVDEKSLQCGAGIGDNCSGKHSGMLAACRHQNYPLENYVDASHPHQRKIAETLREVCCLDEGEVCLGIDGCSVPTFHFPISRMALGFARMSAAEKHFDGAAASAVHRIVAAMAEHPGGHTGEPAYAEVLGEQTPLLTKGGANGVYCAGVVGRGIGFAMKVTDGSQVPTLPVFTEAMRRLGVFSDEEAGDFREKFWPKIESRRGRKVGEIETLL